MRLSRPAMRLGSHILGSQPGRLFSGPRGRLESTASGPSRAVTTVQRPLASCLPGISHVQVRGKRTKTVVKLEDLPQGAIKFEPLPADEVEEATPAYPTVILQAKRNMQKFDNCVLLTRVGGFYEMYFEHAQEYGPLLNLKVASKKTNAGPVPMVRVPCPTRGSGLMLI